MVMMAVWSLLEELSLMRKVETVALRGSEQEKEVLRGARTLKGLSSSVRRRRELGSSTWRAAWTLVICHCPPVSSLLVTN